MVLPSGLRRAKRIGMPTQKRTSSASPSRSAARIRTGGTKTRAGSAPWAAVQRIAKKEFGVTRFRPGQREIIEAVLGGRDAVGLLPTGAGKSLCFQVPAQLLEGTTIVVSPLLALIQDQTDKLEDRGVLAARLDSTLTTREEREAIANVRSGDRIVYVTPERLEKPEVIADLRKGGVSLFVIDEAHCVSQWGHDFRPAYLSLREAIQGLGRPPILALTATATYELLKDVVDQLGMKDPEIVRTDAERTNLFFEVKPTPSEDKKLFALVELLKSNDDPAIVYTATIASAEALHTSLKESGIDAAIYHGRLKKADRLGNQHAFMNDEKRVIVATSAFGLGIDKPNVRLVVHYMFPDSLESYYQEAGRAGRDGKAARAVLLYRLEDRRVRSYFLGGKYPKQEALLAVYEAMRNGSRRGQLAGLVEKTQLAEKKVKVIVAELIKMGVARREGDRLALVREFADARELERFTTSYRKRFEADRQKLSEMMSYAQSTACRVSCLLMYFGETPTSDCNHCDNCRDRPAENAVSPEPARPDPALPEHAPPPFAVGARVRHRRFGVGTVTAVAEEHVDVAFAQGGARSISVDFLKAVAED